MFLQKSSSKRNLERHINSHHTEEEFRKKEKCPVCHKVSCIFIDYFNDFFKIVFCFYSQMVTNKTTLNQHLKIHTGLKRFKCPQCGKVLTPVLDTFQANWFHFLKITFVYTTQAFSNSGHLTGHLKGVHKTGEPLKCDHCDKVMLFINLMCIPKLIWYYTDRCVIGKNILGATWRFIRGRNRISATFVTL